MMFVGIVYNYDMINHINRNYCSSIRILHHDSMIVNCDVGSYIKHLYLNVFENILSTFSNVLQYVTT